MWSNVETSILIDEIESQTIGRFAEVNNTGNINEIPNDWDIIALKSKKSGMTK